MAKKDYTVPIEIRKYKPKGTMVKKLPGGYYVYEYKNIKDEKTGKWKIKMGSLIGTIKEGIGFIPNSNKNYLTDITACDYGQYTIVLANTQNTLQELINVFNKEDAYTIYVISVIHLVNGFVYLKNINEYFEQSYLSIKYPALKLGYTSLSTLIESLGRNQTNVEKFQQQLIDNSSKELAIDGHMIKNASYQNDLAAYGNKYSKFNEMQINVLMVYDIVTEQPLTSRIFNGAMLDKSSVQELLCEYEFKNVLFIVDRGFYSKQNISLFSSNGNSYIIPLSENLVTYKKVIANMVLKDRFIYQKGKKKTIIEYKENIIKETGKRVIIFRDMNQNIIEQEDYLSKIGINEHFTNEKFEEIKEYFGVIVLETNISEETTPKEIFSKYKERWKIETFYNYFKNKAEFEGLYQDNYYKTQGLAFIMLIVGRLYEEMRKKIKNKGYENISDCILEMKKIKLIKIKGNWKKSNVTNKSLEKLEKLGVDLSEEI